MAKKKPSPRLPSTVFVRQLGDGTQSWLSADESLADLLDGKAFPAGVTVGTYELVTLGRYRLDRVPVEVD